MVERKRKRKLTLVEVHAQLRMRRSRHDGDKIRLDLKVVQERRLIECHGIDWMLHKTTAVASCTKHLPRPVMIHTQFPFPVSRLSLPTHPSIHLRWLLDCLIINVPGCSQFLNNQSLQSSFKLKSNFSTHDACCDDDYIPSLFLECGYKLVTFHCCGLSQEALSTWCGGNLAGWHSKDTEPAPPFSPNLKWNFRTLLVPWKWQSSPRSFLSTIWIPIGKEGKKEGKKEERNPKLVVSETEVCRSQSKSC